MARGLFHRRARVFFALVALASALATSASAQSTETPRRGGVLLAVIGADPPSLDPHQESTFATIQLVAPLYSTLLQIDPYNYPKIIGDAATEWKVAPDGLTYTFKIRQGIRFHDGSPLTAADVKATYDKIVFPPEGVRSMRKRFLHGGREHRGARPEHGGVQAQVPVGLAPEQPGLAVERDLSRRSTWTRTRTTSRRTSWAPGPSSSRATRGDPRSRASGTPTTSSRTGPTSTGTSSSSAPRPRCAPRRSAPGAPTSSSATCPAPRWRRSRSSWATRSPSSRRSVIGQFGIAINNTVKPFNDVRVRKALTLGLDRYTAGRVLLPAHRSAGRRGTDAAGHRVGDAAGRAREVPGLRAGRREEPGRGQAAPGRGGLPERPQGRAEEPQREAALPGLRGLRDPGVAEDRDRGRESAARDGRLVRGRAGHRATSS